MLSLRTFRNTDPPHIATLWRRCASQWRLYLPVKIDLLEEFIFGKLYFDYTGLQLAFQEGRLVGLAHAAFGPDPGGRTLDHNVGVISLVLVDPDCNVLELATKLIAACEQYLRRNGAKVIIGGGLRPFDPFYLGLIRCSEVPGVFDHLHAIKDAFARNGYRVVETTVSYTVSLSQFSMPMNFRQIQLRRQLRCEFREDPPARTWWEACVMDITNHWRFRIVSREGGPGIAYATCWLMNLTFDDPADRAVGLMDLSVASEWQERGVATYLVSEICRHFSRQGISVLSILARESIPATTRICQRLGMTPGDRAVIYQKQLE